jgi:hypothetical protein
VEPQTLTLEYASTKLSFETLYPSGDRRRIYIEARSRRSDRAKLGDQKRALPVFPFHTLHFCMYAVESHGFILQYRRLQLNDKRRPRAADQRE